VPLEVPFEVFVSFVAFTGAVAFVSFTGAVSFVGSETFAVPLVGSDSLEVPLAGSDSLSVAFESAAWRRLPLPVGGGTAELPEVSMPSVPLEV